MNRYRVSYAHREPPSRESGASPLHLSMEERAGRRGEKQEVRGEREQEGKEREGRGEARLREGWASANSFDPGIAARYLSAVLVIDPGL